MDQTTKLCHCGQPLHYTDEKIKENVEKVIAEEGEYITVTYIKNGKSYKVQRHYIALHGVFGHQLEELGFEEVKK
jgi:hypothetical protein